MSEQPIIYNLIHFQESFIMVYSIIAYVYYLGLTILAFFALHKYLKGNGKVNYNLILSSNYVPSIALIAPAYNEEMTIIENVKSLLGLHYNNYEVIIVNDGSGDQSLKKLISEFKLEKVKYNVTEKIETNRIRGIYKSKYSALEKLTVIDKENGGKADALNAGLNVSNGELIACIDVDCILEKDSLTKMVKPFMDREDVIATGGVVRVANSCKIKNGMITEVVLPTGLFARFQVLEYMRAFLIGRMAWSSLNGLLLVSGALGLFKKDIVIECGGYDKNTVGEDMELVVRMRRYMCEKGLKNKIVYVPDPLCWTEVPSTKEVLKNQRNRWTRGTMDVMFKHRKMFFNRRFGILGMLSMPLWAIYEWIAPVLEFLGFTGSLVSLLLGSLNVKFWLVLFLAAYSFVVMLSIIALLTEEMSYFKYTKKTDLLKMLMVAMIEPFLFYPLKVLWAVQGNIQKIMGSNSWGDMKRKGFEIV